MKLPTLQDKLLHEILLGLLGSEELAIRWWASPNKHWNGKCPKDVPIEEVKNYLLHHAFVGGGS